MSTPSEQLAANIVARLVSEGLMSADQAKRLEPSLAAGKVTGADWRLPIELAIPEPKKAAK
jgi:hypothetical protein